MDAPLDRFGASRAELLARIEQLRDENADLRRDQARLQAQVASQQAELGRLTERVGALLAALESRDGPDPPRPTGMPGLKPVPRGGPAPAAPRKRRTRGYGRRRMRPTARQVHAYAQCPHCQTALGGGTVKRTREVIELIPGRVEVTEHVYVQRRCPRCHGRWLPGAELDGVVIGQGRLGVGVLSLIATLREELRLPIAGIQW